MAGFGSDLVFAHPVPSFTYDRKVSVALTPEAVLVKYVIELTEFTVLRDGGEIIDPKDLASLSERPERQRPAFLRDAFAKAIAPLLADRLEAWQDDAVLTFALESLQRNDQHLTFDFQFKAKWSK